MTASGTAQPADRHQTRRQARLRAQRVRQLLFMLGTQASARKASSARKQAWVLIIPAAFLYLLFLFMALFSLASAWHDGNWGVFWEHMAEVLFAGHFALSGNAFGALAALREGARSLRQAVTEGDDALAPPAAVQPGPLTGSELVTGPLRVGPLHRYATEPVPRQRIALAVFIAVFGTLMTAFLLALLTNPFFRRHGPGPAGSLLVAVTIPIFFVFAFTILFTLRLRRGYYVQVDDYGIRRPGRGGQAVIPWSDVHGFFCVTYQPNPRRSPVTEYLLDGGRSLMRWRLPADATLSATAGGLDTLDAPLDVGRAGFAPPSTPLPSAGWSERDRSLDTFARLIVARAHVPLRDITPALQRIAAAAQTQAKPKRGLFGMLSTMKQASQMAAAAAAQPAVPGAYAPATFAPVALGDTAQPAEKKRRRFLPESRALRVVLVVQLALALLLAAAGFGLQRLQPGYYHGLLTAVHAQRPLYTTTLAANDGLWPEHGLTADDPSSTYAFVNGAYQLSGTREGWTVNPLAKPAYRGPLAVEATVTQLTVARFGGVGALLYYRSQPES